METKGKLEADSEKNITDKILKEETPEKEQSYLYLQVIDAVLILIENLLAFRVVISFLGGNDGGLIHRITAPFILPFFFLEKFLTLKADNSVLELIPVILVFVLTIIHSYLDKKFFYA